MVIPFKITEWGKFIHSCIKHLQTGCRSGVHISLQNRLLTSSNKVSAKSVLSCSIVQHISPPPALLLQPSAIPGFAQAHGPVPCSVWRNTGKSHCLAPYLMFPPSACKASPAFLAEMQVQSKIRLLQILARSVVTQSRATAGEGHMELDPRDSQKERTWITS